MTIPDIPPSVDIDHMREWCKALAINPNTADAVMGKAPGTFKRYLEGTNQMKQKDFATLQDYLRTRADALRNQ